MSVVPHLNELIRHMCWADTTVWNAVLASPQGSTDQKLGDTLYHIHLVQHIFLQSWTGSLFSVRPRTEFSTLSDLMSWGRDAHREAVRFMQDVTADALDQPFRMPWAAHFEERSKQPAGVHTLGESALQVVLHTQHHRGQVCARLRDVGGGAADGRFHRVALGRTAGFGVGDAMMTRSRPRLR